MEFEYIRNTYNVPAEIGREILFQGKRKGIIVSDKGNYIGVNFDDDKPGVVSSLHPTSEVKYIGIGKIRKTTRSQRRYRDWLHADNGQTFAEYIGIKRKY